jgi:predicted RNase H-like HicB family nuclease/DNA-binding XRE family transcriptional regulator
MRFEGQVKKDGRFWLAEIPAFDALTQGRTKKEALAMASDLLETMADATGFEVTVYPTSRETFEIGANRVGTLLALLLRRQRERQGLTLAEAAERLGQRSRNAYARYEQGKAMPTLEKLEQLLRAIAPDQRIVWRIAA